MTHAAARLTTIDSFTKFALAGNATFTLVSVKTGARFTYKVRAVAEERRTGPVSHFVSVLTGANNEEDYTYLGQLYGGRVDYRRGYKSQIGQEAPSAKAFAWLVQALTTRETLPDSLEIWHEGACGRCGRKLTVPESIASGFGPECINHV